MSIGYACITVGVPGTAQKTTVQKYATPQKLEQLIGHNLAALQNILEYNAAQGIRLFRVSSDIIPFGSSPVNGLDWPRLFAPQLAALGAYAMEQGMRLSMHPGQYTVLNSPDEDVVRRAVEDLQYHTGFLDALGLDAAHKIILHIGGAYGDKAAAIRRFAQSYHALDEGIRRRLVIENDDRIYNAAEVLEIARAVGIPMVYDNLHNAVNPGVPGRTDAEWIRLAAETWREEDGRPKVHYSQQAQGKKPGSHSATINAAEFVGYYASLGASPPDVMLEVKDKNLSCVKCINCTRSNGHIKYLEAEWALYKYTVLERAPDVYAEIRALLKDKTAWPAVQFYALVDTVLARQIAPGSAINAAQHVWGYFKNKATEAEKQSMAKALEAYAAGKAGLGRVKGLLRRLAEKYNEQYLLHSYYFVL